MAQLKVFAETGADGGCLLFTFEPPGMLARGNSVEEALGQASSAASRLDTFLAECGRPYPGAGPSPEILVAETVKRRGKVANGNTSVSFQKDKEPLEAEEIPRFLTVLAHQRKELLDLKAEIPQETYGFKFLPHRKTIEEQLKHIAACERWYLSRLWTDLPRLPRAKDVWEKLALNRELVEQVMQDLTPEDRARVVGIEGEVWTCRKVLRRLMYHERFHIDTTKRDLSMFLSGCRNDSEK
ncbi:MAG: hypothetical protein FH749_04625 [Firmicutes bacterium]|nr:hypothetical protein [Bacillota bacterium]